MLEYNLVIIELKRVLVFPSVCARSWHGGHGNGNRFTGWATNICWVISQLMDQPAEQRRAAGVPGWGQKTSTQRVGPNPPERGLNDARPLTDNKTMFSLLKVQVGAVCTVLRREPALGRCRGGAIIGCIWGEVNERI